MAFPNVYTHRRVAQSNARSCDICYKPSTSVLITPDNKVRPLRFPPPQRPRPATSRTRRPNAVQDWFYVCPSHLKDPAFCTPKIDHAAIEARKERELQEEVARLKEEYEERQKRKREKAGEDGNKDGSGDKNKEDKPSEDEARTQNKPESAGAVSTPFALACSRCCSCMSLKADGIVCCRARRAQAPRQKRKNPACLSSRGEEPGRSPVSVTTVG